jgi:hypothetical protein
MLMNMKVFCFLKPACFLVGIFLLFLSCNARISGPLNADGSAVLSVNMSLEPRIAALIRTLTAAVGEGQAEILNGSAISRSMSNAPGIVSVSLRNTSPAAIEGQIQISKVSEFLAAGNKKGFITFEQGRSGGRCAVSINRETGPEILNYLSPEINDYLNALMAPLSTGEDLSKTEYLELVSSVYNKAISDEISGSRVRASFDFPGRVTSVKGGTFSGRRADFDIALLDLLVLETPFNWEVNWN